MSVSLRKFPYPYKAMLAISNDIDSFDIELFRDIHRNIRSTSSLNIPLADSIWMFAAGAEHGKQIAFYNMEEKLSPYAKELIFYCRNGLIDTLHTYGNFSKREKEGNSFSRYYAEKSIEFIKENKISFNVWVNHGDESNTQNVGKHKYMQGDALHTPSYHADLMKEAGVKYIWNPRVRDVFSHESMLEPMQLRDGSSIWSFPRFHAIPVNEENREYLKVRGCKFWGKDKSEAIVWSPDLLDLSVNKKNIDELVEAGGYSIVTQHIGYCKEMGRTLPEQALSALTLLKDYQDKGEVLVATTSDLLNYNRVNNFVKYVVKSLDNGLVIDVIAIDDPVLGSSKPSVKDLAGLCFYCEDPWKTFISIDGTLIKSAWLKRNASDGRGPSIEVDWSMIRKTVDDVVSRFHINSSVKARPAPVKVSFSEKKEGMPEKQASVALWERAKKRAEAFAADNCSSLSDRLEVAICIGGMKCGTTTLWSELSKTSGIAPCIVKEPSYFGQKRREPPTLDEYLSLFPIPKSEEPIVATFEASTHYTKYPKVVGVPEQIYSVVPHAKIIYLVRDPISRIESQIAHHISRGEMKIEDFHSKKWRTNKHLINLSKYYMQISQYLEFFSREKVHLIQLEELIESPSEVLSKLLGFIGVNKKPSIPRLEKENPRRGSKGADQVALSAEDKAYIRSCIDDDILTLEKNFPIKRGFWKTYWVDEQ